MRSSAHTSNRTTNRGASARKWPRTIAVFDFDGTLTRYDTYLRYLILSTLARLTRLTHMGTLPIDVLRHKLGWQDNSWLKQRFLSAILGGWGDTDLAIVTGRLFTELLNNGFRAEGLAELERHRRLGHRTVLLSAGFDFYLAPIANQMGFSDCICSNAERNEHGVLTGRIAGANCYGMEKVRRIKAILDCDLDLRYLVVYGDHETDFPLMRIADEAYIINPRPTLARKAEEIGIRILRW